MSYVRQRNTGQRYPGDGNATRDNSQAVEIPDVSTVLIKAGTNFVKRHKMLTGMYLFGLFLVLFAGGLSVSSEQERSYYQIMNEIDLKKLQRAEERVMVRRDQYRRSKGWFSCDAQCEINYQEFLDAENDLQKIEAKNYETMKRAKQQVGLFSEYGVEEVRNLFWEQFAGGKDFAKRSSWWDLIFMSIGSIGRDESLVEFAIRFFINALMNITVGMTGALVGFYYYVWGVIASYGAGTIMAFVMFVLACTAATSFMVSFIIGIYGAAAGTVYVAAKVAVAQGNRLSDAQRRQAASIRH